MTLVNQTRHLIWQLLTKRPQHYLCYLPLAFKHNNVWLGASAENQHFYDIRWPHLYATAKHYGCIAFISYEPALGPLTISEAPNRPDWIICGGETGHGHRPMERKWADDIKAECERYGVQFWMKQMSALTPAQGAAFIPVELLIRQFPSTNGSHNYPAADHQEHRADGPQMTVDASQGTR